jgi:type IV secretory pathway TraG/TraD family ATPase VirD4
MFGKLYIFFVRLDDLIGLILSQFFTLFGMIQFVSADELIHKRNPARFMRWSERKLLLNQFNGGFLLDGKVGRLSQKKSFQSILTVGGMGTGKTANLIMPNLLTADNCSLVITDTSGEIFEQTVGYLSSQGYDIKILNLIDPTRSHGYNPLANVKSYSDAERIAHIITHARGGQSKEPIWDEGAKRLIRIIVRALKNSPGSETANLTDVHRWLNHFDAHTDSGKFDKFIVENTLEDQATFEDYQGFSTTAPEKMLLSFVSTASTALSLVGNTDIAQVLKRNDFDFAAMKGRKTAVYVMVRQQDMEAFGFILSLFYTELCNTLLQDRAGKLPVYMFLDEFGHLKIPGFETFATTARKYKVGFWLIVQSLAQLVEQYGQNGARTILGGIGTESYFGGMDLETAQNISGRLGTAFRLNVLKPSQGLHEKPLMRPDQLIRMRDNDLLVLHSNRDPVMVHTVPYYVTRGKISM